MSDTTDHKISIQSSLGWVSRAGWEHRVKARPPYGYVRLLYAFCTGKYGRAPGQNTAVGGKYGRHFKEIRVNTGVPLGNTGVLAGNTVVGPLKTNKTIKKARKFNLKPPKHHRKAPVAPKSPQLSPETHKSQSLFNPLSPTETSTSKTLPWAYDTLDP